MKKFLISLLITTVIPCVAFAKHQHADFPSEDDLKNFEFNLELVYPSTRISVNRFNPEGYITVNDSIAAGDLPYFGKVFYTNNILHESGIKFDNVMKKVKTENIYKNKKRTKIKSIEFSFNIEGFSGENYQIRFSIFEGGRCRVYVSNENRSSIAYTGRIDYTKKQ